MLKKKRKHKSQVHGAKKNDVQEFTNHIFLGFLFNGSFLNEFCAAAVDVGLFKVR